MEGVIGVADALESGAQVLEIFVAADEASRGAGRERDIASLRRIADVAESAGVRMHHVGNDVIGALSDTSTPQGVVAVVGIPDVSLSDIVGAADLVLVLAEVRDPGNAGTLVRSALGAGAAGVVFARGTVDAWTSKTVRASAGAVFRVPISSGLPLEGALSDLRGNGFTLVGTDATAAVAPEDVDLTGRVALVVGNESWGIPAPSSGLLDVSVGIPMPGPAESLNAGIAGSILLFEAVRQRRGGRVYPLAPHG